MIFHPPSGPELNVERYDAGPPGVVLIHGGGDGAYIWDLFAPVLARRFTTISVDLRGHGNSGWDIFGRYGRDDYASDLAHIIDRSHLPEFVVIGHSLGAQIAIHLCAAYRERVKACVLVDFAPELVTEGTDHARFLLEQSLKTYPTVDAYATWLKDTRVLAQPAVLEHLAASALCQTNTGFRLRVDPALIKAFPRIEPAESRLLWSLLERQRSPTLIVRGNGSAVVSRAVARRAAEALPNGELVTIDDAGHAVMVDNPGAFERTVIAFLEKHLAERMRESA